MRSLSTNYFSRLLILSIATALSGCASKHGMDEALRLSTSATGLHNAFVFQTEGGALDVPGGGGPTLPLSSAVRQALETSPEIQASLAKVRQAEADLQQEQLLPNPVVSIILRFPEGGGTPAFEASLAADFLSLLQRPGRISAADNRLGAAGIDAVSTVLNVLADVQEKYAEVQSLDSLVPILQERQKLTVRLESLAQARLAAGEAARLDVLVAQSQRVDVEVEISQKQTEARQARVELARLIGRPSGATDWILPAWQSPMKLANSESKWIETGLNHRPEIAFRNYELAALGAELGISRLDILQNSEIGADAQHEPDWSVGPALSVPLPIFDWGQAHVAKARGRVIEIKHELVGVKRDIVRDVRLAHIGYSSALESLARVRDELIPLDQRRLEQAESAYKAGLVDITTVVLAGQELVAARARLVELEQKTSSALIQLQRAVGGPMAVPAGDRQNEFNDSSGQSNARAASTTQPSTAPSIRNETK